MNRRAEGLRAWVWQRISALYLAFFVLFLVSALLAGYGSSFANWHAWVANPYINILIAIFFIMLFVHAWIGVRDIILDYIKPLWLRAGMLLAVGLGLSFSMIWSMRTLVLVVLK